jgi:acetyltransferase-like isoleucine patch superfamily enzyme
MKKELRFTKQYKLFYYLFYYFGKLFFIVKLFSYNIYSREAFNIFRAGMWSVYFKDIGFGSKIDSNVIIRYNPKKLEIGSYTHIDTSVQLELHEILKIGSYVHIAPNVYIQTGAEVIIEDHVGIANGTKIYSKSNTYKSENKTIHVLVSTNSPIKNQASFSGRIHIKKNVILAMNSVILPGVTIGENSVVAPNTVIYKDVPDNCIAIGNPVKIIKK